MNRMKYTDEFLMAKKFGALTYLRASHVDGKKYYGVWKCDCGGETIAINREVAIGQKKSCECHMFRKGANHGLWSGHEEITGSHWRSIRDNAKKRDIKVLITIEYAWKKFISQDRKCAITGVELTLSEDGVRYGRTASLDRIDASKDYTEDNVRWVHKDINYIKRDISDERFFELCKMVANKT